MPLMYFGFGAVSSFPFTAPMAVIFAFEYVKLGNKACAKYHIGHSPPEESANKGAIYNILRTINTDAQSTGAPTLEETRVTRADWRMRSTCLLSSLGRASRRSELDVARHEPRIAGARGHEPVLASLRRAAPRWCSWPRAGPRVASPGSASLARGHAPVLASLSRAAPRKLVATRRSSRRSAGQRLASFWPRVAPSASASLTRGHALVLASLRRAAPR